MNACCSFTATLVAGHREDKDEWRNPLPVIRLTMEDIKGDGIRRIIEGLQPEHWAAGVVEVSSSQPHAS